MTVPPLPPDKDDPGVQLLRKEPSLLPSISLASATVYNLTIQKATDPKQCHPVRLLLKAHGYEDVIELVTHLVVQADAVCGGSITVAEAEMMAALVLRSYAHMSIESIALAMFDGLARQGSTYTKIKAPVIMEWLREHDNAILNLAQSEHSRSKTTNDNLGTRYLDKLEAPQRESERQTRIMRREIEQLREKLSNKTKNT